MRRRPERSILALTGLFCLVLPVCAALAQPAGPAPADCDLRVEPPEVELGDVPAAADVDFELTLHNTCDHEIALVYIYAECDCSFAMPSRGVVPAGGSLVLELTFRLQDALPGPVSELVTILTDLPGRPELRVPVGAEVLADGSAAGSPEHLAGSAAVGGGRDGTSQPGRRKTCD